MANRKQRASTAAETMEIFDRGMYTIDGHAVSISDQLAESCRNTLLYTPDELDGLIMSLKSHDPVATTLSVLNCTTFAAARQLRRTASAIHFA